MWNIINIIKVHKTCMSSLMNNYKWKHVSRQVQCSKSPLQTSSDLNPFFDIFAIINSSYFFLIFIINVHTSNHYSFSYFKFYVRGMTAWVFKDKILIILFNLGANMSDVLPSNYETDNLLKLECTWVFCVTITEG